MMTSNWWRAMTIEVAETVWNLRQRKRIGERLHEKMKPCCELPGISEARGSSDKRHEQLGSEISVEFKLISFRNGGESARIEIWGSHYSDRVSEVVSS
jgi:hypothetical protein